MLGFNNRDIMLLLSLLITKSLHVSANVCVGGSYYGSLKQPSHRGSRGGDGNGSPGGLGGGVVNMLIGARAFIDGSVLADASAGSSSSGGGSGGSILIQTAELEGFGTVTANGGESWVLRWLAAVSPSFYCTLMEVSHEGGIERLSFVIIHHKLAFPSFCDN
jgi:hypothetical protein